MLYKLSTKATERMKVFTERGGGTDENKKKNIIFPEVPVDNIKANMGNLSYKLYLLTFFSKKH